MAVKLKNMSRKELLQLQKDVEAELKKAETRDRREALKAAEQAAAEFGFALSELGGSKRGAGKQTKSAPRYKNPENENQTWTGKGRKPQWVHDALGAGKELSDLEI
jgi:DNA-binding protein H-NS